jgi:spermidine/putrescine transport system permease protein
MKSAVVFGLRLYTVLVFLFILAPIAASFVVSLNVDRFPTLPLGGFSLKWYDAVINDTAVAGAITNTLLVGVVVSLVSTFIGFATAYTDFRYQFFGKSVYLALALLPPTIPTVIMGLAMLAYLSTVNLWGGVHSAIIAHVVLCTPFAMALIRLRLSQMDPDMESAAWNLGATQWRAMWSVILPFAVPSIVSALLLTMAVSFDEFIIAWFITGFNETLPVKILNTLQGRVSPKINAMGSMVFSVTIMLVIISQAVLFARGKKARGVQDASGA